MNTLNKMLGMSNSQGKMHKMDLTPNLVNYNNGDTTTFISTEEIKALYNFDTQFVKYYHMGVFIDISSYYTKIIQNEAYLPRTESAKGEIPIRIENVPFSQRFLTSI